AVATCKVVIVLGALLLQIARSESPVERSDHKCGQYPDGKWAHCGRGRCCSTNFYCGDNWEHCDGIYCWYQCHQVPYPPRSDHEVAHETAGGEVLVAPLPLNDTLHNRYLNGDHDLVEVRPANASSSSSSSFSSPLSSCAASLSRLPLASRHKYPFAALPAPRSQNNNATATHCGRCLKVTSFGVEGLPNQVKVRIAHEHTNQGLELDFNTFKQLDTDSRGITKGRIFVKYQFDSC
ncbi:unnamed protein product, partial [Linum tenue]